MKIGILGTGVVGRTFAARLAGLGHESMLGTRDVAEKLASTTMDYMGNPPFSEWYKSNNNVRLGTFSEAAAFGELIINATHGGSSLGALNLAGTQNLNGKVLMDVANPLDFSQANSPSLIPGLSNTTSLAEVIQSNYPEVYVVKTLNTLTSSLMVNPQLVAGGDHVNFISGNDNEAKLKVRNLLYQFGWKDENLMDLGDITAARGTEMYLPLWIRLWGATKTGVFNIKLAI